MSNMVSLYDDMSAELIASSINPDGIRLDTYKLRYWRATHAELMTHRQFSRNASSSRAIPNSKLSDQPILYPVFRKNQPGMQPGAPLSLEEQHAAEEIWDLAARGCLEAAKELSAKDGLNVHKQWVNRMLEWFGSIDVIVSSTDWANFFALRDHPDAQDEIRHLAKLMKAERDRVEPVKRDFRDSWHLPFIVDSDDAAIEEFLACRSDALTRQDLYGEPAEDLIEQAEFAFRYLPGDLPVETKIKLVISAARCARASYQNFRGDTSIQKDFETFFKLVKSQPVHASPLEHQARACTYFDGRQYCGNFTGWQQFRKYVPNEALFDR